MGYEHRIKRLEQWLYPAPVIPIYVYIIVPGNRMYQDRVYRENQFLPGCDEPLLGAVSCAPELASELRNEDGKVYYRCYVCYVPEG
ncbi:MAG: hypothetical protein HGA72_07050 [Chlorobiaceae bacterium]|nr:hypothetical protein [Chlorobiaceae bacterium]